MAECLAPGGGGAPSPGHRTLYSRWASGGWGMVITGNMQIDPHFLATPWDVSLPAALGPGAGDRDVVAAPYEALAETFAGTGTPLVVQISHPGRQAALGCRWPFWTAVPLAPSAVKVGRGGKDDESWISWAFNGLLFRTPREVGDEELEGIVRRFGEVAAFLESCGFSGVQVHGAHGCECFRFMFKGKR